jgi:hemerythrin-like domain-containing protein
MTSRPAKKHASEPRLFRELRRDHANVLEEIGALEAALAPSGGRKRAAANAEASLPTLVALLESQFASHMAAEDEVLYPALLGVIPAAGGSIEPLFAEHAELRQMLVRLAATLREPATAERSEQIRVQVHDLADLLRLHIRKEESLVFRLAPQLLSPREIAAVSARLSQRQRTTPATRRKARRPKGDVA